MRKGQNTKHKGSGVHPHKQKRKRVVLRIMSHTPLVSLCRYCKALGGDSNAAGLNVVHVVCQGNIKSSGMGWFYRLLAWFCYTGLAAMIQTPVKDD